MPNARIAWLGLGLVIGLIVGLNLAGLWPQIPVHAVATHGQDNFAISTGGVDMDVEGIFILDFLTGALKGAVLNTQTRTFTTFYEYNVAKDLLTEGQKNPRYLMVTGASNLRQGAQMMQLGQCVIYVAEVSSGQVAAYGVPWIAGRANYPIRQQSQFILLDGFKFRTTAIRN